MRTQLEGIIRSFGQTVTLIPRKSRCETRFQAFLQPVLKEREDLPVTATPLGAVNGQRWLYVGPAAREISEGDMVHLDGIHLTVQEATAVYFRGEVLYHRAILRQEKEWAV